MAKNRRRISDDPVVQELSDIKRLLVLQLLASGVQGAQIAAALQVDKATVSRLVPSRLAKRATRNG